MVPTIPSGHKIIMQDAPYLDFEWRDGKIVPVTDAAVEALNNYKFIKGPGSSRFWMVVVGLILVVVAGYLKIREIRQKRQD